MPIPRCEIFVKNEVSAQNERVSVRQTDRILLSISRVNMLTRDKTRSKIDDNKL